MCFQDNGIGEVLALGPLVIGFDIVTDILSMSNNSEVVELR